MSAEIRPSGFRCCAPEVCVHALEDRTQVRVRGAFLGGEVQVQRDRVEAGEKSAGEVADGELEDRRPHELAQAGRGTGIAWRRGREPKASVRDRHLESLVAKATAEMVHLIDDEKVEAITERLYVPIRCFECRHADRRHAAYAVSVAPDRSPIHGADLSGPLLEQDTGRHEAQRAQSRPLHGGKSQPRLAASCRERDDTASLTQFPCRQRRLLIGTEIDVRPRLAHRSRTRRDALELDAAREEPALEGRVPACGRAIRAYAAVPEGSRCGAEG